MIFIDNYEQFKYTRIQVTFTLKINPADYEDCTHYTGLVHDLHHQKHCYIGTQLIDTFSIKRLGPADSAPTKETQWEIEMIISDAKKEIEVIAIVEKLCQILSLRCSSHACYVQNSGLHGFTFRPMNIKRSYAVDLSAFSDIDFNHWCGYSETIVPAVVQSNIFELPVAPLSQTPFVEELDIAFLTAMRSTDPVSRYILLYYLFEIFYRQTEFQAIKQKYEEKAKREDIRHENKHVKRSEILYQYLYQKFNLTKYCSFGKNVILSPQILFDIISVRNNLTHRADTTNLSRIMYHHLIPILQQILRELE